MMYCKCVCMFLQYCSKRISGFVIKEENGIEETMEMTKAVRYLQRIRYLPNNKEDKIDVDGEEWIERVCGG